MNTHAHHYCALTSLSVYCLSPSFAVSSGHATESSDAAAACASAAAADDDAAAYISIPAAATAGSLHCPGETPHTPGALRAGPPLYASKRNFARFEVDAVLISETYL